ncbi:MAG TPA: flagellar basal body P-ring formation chaperone FlgA [Steroidobacteraceae bacterium]|nr:flagellar basal body P-ring formation chaperone FlgA [Steroidobacteraceae bacterium]
MIELASKTRRRARGRTAAAFLCGALCLGGAAATAATAVGIQPLQPIRAAAEGFVRSQMPPGKADIVVTANRLDPRLRLAHCGGPLEATFISGARLQAQVSVAVSCRAAANWTVYVPVTVQSRIRVFALRGPQTQGARLGASDVAAETRLVSGLAVGYVTDVSELAHATLRHPLPAGAVLTSGDLLPDFMVRQGEQVTLVASIDGVQVRAAGLALQDGRRGALVRVQNASSSKVVQGIVESNRVVDVTP